MLMFSPQFVRLGSSLALLWALLWLGGAAQIPPGDNQALADFDRLAEIFALPGASRIKGEPWVVVDTGPANWPWDLEGWLIEEGANEMLLLDWYGEIHKLRKPAPKEERPAIHEEEDGTFDLTELQDADRSVAWKIRREDYHAKSRKFLADGLPEEKDEEGVLRLSHPKFRQAAHIVDAARYAHFAQHLGRTEHAEELYAYALNAYKKYADSHFGGYEESAALPVFVADQIAFGKRSGAIFSAHHGAPRKELEERWQKVAAIPHHQYRDEAKAMVRHYRSLLDEDARWVEPSAEDFEKLTTEKKVAYWLYHLRDLDIGQMIDPGHCHVLRDYNRGRGGRGKQEPNAAKELEKLGLAAVPELIAHLDDARPTRCKGHWRWYWPEGHYLLRYGDCCQQIFESITGETILKGGRYPIQDGAGKECKEKAEKWWQEYQKTNPKK
jgi:hypothetical protein